MADVCMPEQRCLCFSRTGLRAQSGRAGIFLLSRSLLFSLIPSISQAHPLAQLPKKRKPNGSGS